MQVFTHRTPHGSQLLLLCYWSHVRWPCTNKHEGFAAGSRSRSSNGLGNWACEWVTFLQSWGIDARRLCQRDAATSRPWAPQLPMEGEAAFTPPPRGHSAFDMQAMQDVIGECCQKFVFAAQRPDAQQAEGSSDGANKLIEAPLSRQCPPALAHSGAGQASTLGYGAAAGRVAPQVTDISRPRGPPPPLPKPHGQLPADIPRRKFQPALQQYTATKSQAAADGSRTRTSSITAQVIKGSASSSARSSNSSSPARVRSSADAPDTEEGEILSPVSLQAGHRSSQSTSPCAQPLHATNRSKASRGTSASSAGSERGAAVSSTGGIHEASQRDMRRLGMVPLAQPPVARVAGVRARHCARIAAQQQLLRRAQCAPLAAPPAASPDAGASGKRAVRRKVSSALQPLLHAEYGGHAGCASQTVGSLPTACVFAPVMLSCDTLSVPQSAGVPPSHLHPVQDATATMRTGVHLTNYCLEPHLASLLSLTAAQTKTACSEACHLGSASSPEQRHSSSRQQLHAKRGLPRKESALCSHAM